MQKQFYGKCWKEKAFLAALNIVAFTLATMYKIALVLCSYDSKIFKGVIIKWTYRDLHFLLGISENQSVLISTNTGFLKKLYQKL